MFTPSRPAFFASAHPPLSALYQNNALQLKLPLNFPCNKALQIFRSTFIFAARVLSGQEKTACYAVFYADGWTPVQITHLITAKTVPPKRITKAFINIIAMERFRLFGS